MKKQTSKQYFEAIGRRKLAIARVRLYPLTKSESVAAGGVKIKSGEILVNKKSINQAFPLGADKEKYSKPLRLVKAEDKFGVTVVVKGGGRQGQLDAIVHGLARALEKADKSVRPLLKKEGLFTRDARIKERRKVGTGGKARRKKQSPKR